MVGMPSLMAINNARLFHGYYGHKIYYPILINEAQSGYPLIVQLRAGNSHPGNGTKIIYR